MTESYSPRERAIIDHLIKQVKGGGTLRASYYGLTYAEKKHLVEELDRDFVIGQLATLRRQARWPVWASLSTVAFAALLFYLSFAAGKVTPTYWNGVWDMVLIAAPTVLLIIGYVILRQRLFVFESFRILSTPEAELATEAGAAKA